MNKKAIALPLEATLFEKKRLGAFYTPPALSDLIASWAINSTHDKILEPSFGGCGFLQSAAKRLNELGASKKNIPLYGCDIDPNAFHYLANTVGSLVDTSRFVLGDFLTLRKPKSWPTSFDTIIGNPPYIPYQQISPTVRDIAIKKIKNLGFDIDLRSSLWAYFIILSLKYLKEGGKIAWVLPGSFLQANYSRTLIKFLGSKFSKIAVFQIKERLFLDEGTDESTIVLLGTGYRGINKEEPKEISLVYCNSSNDLKKSIKEWQSGNAIEASCASPCLLPWSLSQRLAFFQAAERQIVQFLFSPHVYVHTWEILGY